MSEVTTRALLITSVVSFVVALGVFVSVHLKLGIPIELGVFIGGIVWAVICLVVIIDVKKQFHRVLLGPIRKYLSFRLSSIVIEKRNIDIRIDGEGNGHAVHEFWGKVNFGFNKWIDFGFTSDTDQSDAENFPVTVTDMETHNSLPSEFIVDCPKYKRLRIYFGRELKTGDKLHIKAEFDWKETFFLGQKDFYEHRTFHNEKRVDVSVHFPKGVGVSKFETEITTQYGDIRGKHDVAEKKSPRLLRWSLENAMHGDANRLIWWTTT